MYGSSAAFLFQNCLWSDKGPLARGSIPTSVEIDDITMKTLLGKVFSADVGGVGSRQRMIATAAKMVGPTGDNNHHRHRLDRRRRNRRLPATCPD